MILEAARSGGRVEVGAERPGLSVVVVSWNSAQFLDDCLTSLFSLRGVTVEAIVVDNGSTDGSQALVRRQHPRARLIEIGENVGFCAANNVGLSAAGAPFVLFANSDIILDPDYAAEGIAPFSRDPRIGMVGGKLLRFDRRTVDSAGQFLTRSRRAVERGYGTADRPEIGAEGYVFSVCGAALLCRREMIEDISVTGQFFDESYFAFSEDLDVGWRARLAGWRAWYAPSAIGYHYRGGTESRENGSLRVAPALLRRPRALRFHILKNRWLTVVKNDAVGSFLRDLPFIALRDAAMLAAALAASPGLIVDLARFGPLCRSARAKRRAFLAAEGRWGRRRAGVPVSWVRWTEPRAVEPEGL